MDDSYGNDSGTRVHMGMYHCYDHWKSKMSEISNKIKQVNCEIAQSEKLSLNYNIKLLF